MLRVSCVLIIMKQRSLFIRFCVGTSSVVGARIVAEHFFQCKRNSVCAKRFTLKVALKRHYAFVHKIYITL